MRQIIGYALSGRTIKRLAKSAGPPIETWPAKNNTASAKKQLNDLIETTSAGRDAFNGNALHFLKHIELELDLPHVSTSNG